MVYNSTLKEKPWDFKPLNDPCHFALFKSLSLLYGCSTALFLKSKLLYESLETLSNQLLSCKPDLFRLYGTVTCQSQTCHACSFKICNKSHPDMLVGEYPGYCRFFYEIKQLHVTYKILINFTASKELPADRLLKTAALRIQSQVSIIAPTVISTLIKDSENFLVLIWSFLPLGNEVYRRLTVPTAHGTP